MHYLYILYSSTLNRYYTGETSNISERIEQHNSGFFKGSYTSQCNDWELKLLMQFKTINGARKAEQFIKRMNSKTFIEKLILEHQWFKERFDV